VDSPTVLHVLEANGSTVIPVQSPCKRRCTEPVFHRRPGHKTVSRYPARVVDAAVHPAPTHHVNAEGPNLND
jgi:hypothetical protein